MPTPSIRTGLILNRFSLTCPILYCTNACFIDPNLAQERSIYDFVAESDEDEVRHLIEIAKGFGMEGGVRNDGGFAYGKFLLYPPGRNSSIVAGYVSHSYAQVAYAEMNPPSPLAPLNLRYLLAQEAADVLETIPLPRHRLPVLRQRTDLAGRGRF